MEKQTNRKTLVLVLGVSVAILLVLSLCLGILLIVAVLGNKEKVAQEPVNQEQNTTQQLVDNSVTLSSDIGHFSIELPAAFNMKQAVERKQVPNDPSMSDYLLGEIVLQQSLDTSPESNRITVSYGKPEIMGKGGSCLGNDGELASPGYVSAVIAGRSMTVCRNNFEMTAAYPKHHTQKIEYVISIQASDQQMFDTLSTAVAEMKWLD